MVDPKIKTITIKGMSDFKRLVSAETVEYKASLVALQGVPPTSENVPNKIAAGHACARRGRNPTE